MGPFMKGLGFLLKDFSCWTSTHGIPHIGMANAIWLRLFWALIVCACVVGFIVQLSSLIQKYLSYPVNTETKLEFSELKFPAVTICHLNPWKEDQVQIVSPYMASMVAAYGNPAADANFDFPAGQTTARQAQAVKMTTMASEYLAHLSPIMGGTGEDPSYTYDDIMISCTFNAVPCNDTEDFIAIFDPDYGQCQQFNILGKQSSSRAGPLYGLRLVLRTDQKKYLPWTEESGVVVSIHDQESQPFPSILGFHAPPGTASSMGVAYTDTCRLSAPYGTCTDQDQVHFTYFKGKYDMQTCYENCMQEKIVVECGCYNPSMVHEGATAPSCFDASAMSKSASNFKCIDDLTNPNSPNNVINSCTSVCKQPCQPEHAFRGRTYRVTVSTSLFPAQSYTPTDCSRKNQTSQPWYRPLMNETEISDACKTWFGLNTVLIEVYYERMNFQVMTESPAYTVGGIVNLVSDIGGQVGLFLGMSIISVIELLTLFLLFAFYCMTHKSRKIELDEIEKSKEEAKRRTEEIEAYNRAKRAGATHTQAAAAAAAATAALPAPTPAPAPAPSVPEPAKGSEKKKKLDKKDSLSEDDDDSIYADDSKEITPPKPH